VWCWGVSFPGTLEAKKLKCEISICCAILGLPIESNSKLGSVLNGY